MSNNLMRDSCVNNWNFDKILFSVVNSFFNSIWNFSCFTISNTYMTLFISNNY